MFKTDETYLLDFAQKLLAIDSPSGYCAHAIRFMEEEAQALGYTCTRNRKGNLLIRVPGTASTHTTALSAHCDTLGLMVRSIKENGTLAVTAIGSPTLPTLDSEYCRILTRDGDVYTGTILCTAASKHVHPDAATLTRDADSLEVRIDEIVHDKKDVEALGIRNGDYIAIDPKTTVTDSGFIKSRFLDDKISCACLFAVLHTLKEHAITLKNDLLFVFSTYEEVGHGASSMPADVDAMLAVDMGCIGLDLACTEYDVSICAKDSSGPYDYAMTTQLIQLAKQEGLSFAVDIYPMYGSDVSAALKGGNDIKGALIGPGVHASHGMERTHIQALNNTVSLILAYLLADA